MVSGDVGDSCFLRTPVNRPKDPADKVAGLVGRGEPIRGRPCGGLGDREAFVAQLRQHLFLVGPHGEAFLHALIEALRPVSTGRKVARDEWRPRSARGQQRCYEDGWYQSASHMLTPTGATQSPNIASFGAPSVTASVTEGFFRPRSEACRESSRPCFSLSIRWGQRSPARKKTPGF